MTEKQKSTNPSDEKLLSRLKDSGETSEEPPKADKPASANEEVTKVLAELEDLRKELREMQEKQIQREKELDAREAQLKGAPAADMKIVSEMHTNKAKRMKEELAKQPTVRMRVELEANEKPGTTFPVTLNGYRLNIPKGVYVDVPQQVADIIAESFNQTQKAGEEFRLDRKDKNTQDALA